MHYLYNQVSHYFLRAVVGGGLNSFVISSCYEGRKQPSVNQAAGFINLLSNPGEREAGRGDVNGDLLNMQPDTCH